MKTLRWGAAAAAAFACVLLNSADGGQPVTSTWPDHSALARALPLASDSGAVIPVQSLAAHKATHLGGELLELSAMLIAQPAMTTAQLGATFPSMSLSSLGGQTMVTLDVTAQRDAGALAASLEALGAKQVSTYGRMLSAHVPVAALDRLDRLSGLLEARPAMAHTDRGAYLTQGDYTLRAPLVRPPAVASGQTGAGITVGILSDSFGCLTRQPDASADVASGDLDTVTVLKELPGCTGGTDEGRAMAQTIADVAPGSRQIFYTSMDGQADFANGIRALADAGATVIVDDTRYFNEPSFQDGIVAQAVDAAFARGVTYFSSAGNYGRLSFESDWRSATNGARINPTATGPQFDFDPGTNSITRQLVTIAAGSRLQVALQWDDSFASNAPNAPGATTDLDFYLVTASNQIVAFSAGNNIGGDPYEFIDYTNTTTASRSLFLVIELHSGPTPGHIKYVNYGTASIPFALPTNSPTALGHTAAAGAFSVGAAAFFNTNACTNATTILELLSSRGGTAILRSPDGTRLDTPVIRQKPDAVGPDGGNTSFYGALTTVTPDQRSTAECQDQDGLANNFFGTSASAAHLAGVAALMRQAAPFATATQFYDALRNTAEDMGTTGVDFDSGFGFVRTVAALGAVVDFAPDDFAFTAALAQSSVTVTSNTITVTGITAPSRVAVAGDPSATFSINGGAFSNVPALVVPGDTVTARVTSAQASNTTVTVTVEVGTAFVNWYVTTGVDNLPDAFTFGSVTLGAAVQYTTPAVTISGINTDVLVTVSGIPGVAYSINGGAFTRANGRLNNGDSVRLQLTTPSTVGTFTALLTTGISGGTLVVNEPTDSSPDPIVFNSASVLPLGRPTSNIVTVTGINVAVPVSLSGDGTAEYSLNGGAYTRVPGTVVSGDRLQLRVRAPLAFNSSTSATLTVGDATGTWTVQTRGLLGGLLGN